MLWRFWEFALRLQLILVVLCIRYGWGGMWKTLARVRFFADTVLGRTQLRPYLIVTLSTSGQITGHHHVSVTCLSKLPEDVLLCFLICVGVKPLLNVRQESLTPIRYERHCFIDIDHRAQTCERIYSVSGGEQLWVSLYHNDIIAKNKSVALETYRRHRRQSAPGS